MTCKDVIFTIIFSQVQLKIAIIFFDFSRQFYKKKIANILTSALCHNNQDKYKKVLLRQSRAITMYILSITIIVFPPNYQDILSLSYDIS
jgi:hypothetical protein